MASKPDLSLSSIPEELPALQIMHLRKTFGARVAVDDVSLTIRRGEVLGYLGPNGAGKSTTLKMIAGLLPPDSGFIRIGGVDLLNEPIQAKRRMGYVPETGALYERLTPLEYLEMIGQLHQLTAEEIQRKAPLFLEYFDLSDQKDTRMISFSKGMKQKVVLCAALLHDPDLLLLDEPLNGLDANTVLMVKGIMTRLAKAGRSIIYSSHILEVVEKICDRIAIISQGRIVAAGNIRELQEITRSPSLELVFKELTQADTIEPRVEAFFRAITDGRSRHAS